MFEYCQSLTCKLTDQFGNPINPYAPGAVAYHSPTGSCEKHRSVTIEGYVAVYLREDRISLPIPFCMISDLCLSVPKASSVTYQVKSFHTWVVVCQSKGSSETGQTKLLISIDTCAFSSKAVSLLVPQIDSDLHIIDSVCISTEQIFDRTQFHSECCLIHKNSEMRVEISQYNTIADGTKRTFLDSDEMKEYGCCGILSPTDVSYFNVFVNGLLQPQKNYILEKGRLFFTTQNIPSKGQSVTILFVTWKNLNFETMDSIEWQYNAVSNGAKKIYRNQDELPEYKSRGIPSPCDVSFFNLFVNGVLQPKSNYHVRNGILELTTKDAPSNGALIILESVIVHTPEQRLVRMNAFAYNAYSNGSKIYTNQNNIPMYGMDGIEKEEDCSYQNLFVNGILQPHINYCTRKNCLIFRTEDSPTINAPITLQSVDSAIAIPYCKTQFSEKALAHWKKIYQTNQYLDDST